MLWLAPQSIQLLGSSILFGVAGGIIFAEIFLGFVRLVGRAAACLAGILSRKGAGEGPAGEVRPSDRSGLGDLP